MTTRPRSTRDDRRPPPPRPDRLAPSLDRHRRRARLPRGRLERPADGGVRLPHLEVGAHHQRRRGGPGHHLGPRPGHRPRRVPLSRALRHPPRDLRDPHRPARLVLRRHRAARPGGPDGPASRRPAGADRRRRRHARGLLRPDHPAAGHRRPRGDPRRAAARCGRSRCSVSPSSRSWPGPGSSCRSSPVACRARRPRRPSRPAASSTPGSSTRSPGLADLIALDRAAAHRERTLALGDELDRATDRLARVRAAATALSGLVASLAGVTVLAIGVALVGDGRLDGVYLAALPLAAVACFEVARTARPVVRPPGRERGRRAPAVRADRRAARGRGRPDRDATPRRPTFGIEIRGLRFRYGPDEPWVLDGLDLSVPAGGSLAIVGPSGTGKSTLVNLLLRFWDYTEGEIRIGGRELHEVRRRRGPTLDRRRARRTSTCSTRPSATTSRWPTPTRPTRRSRPPAGWRSSTTSSRRSRPATRPASARTACSCQAASVSGWPSPGRSSRTPRSSSSTRRRPTSTSRPNAT